MTDSALYAIFTLRTFKHIYVSNNNGDAKGASVSRFMLIFVSIIFFALLIVLLQQCTPIKEQSESTIIENAESVTSEGIIKRTNPEDSRPLVPDTSENFFDQPIEN